MTHKLLVAALLITAPALALEPDSAQALAKQAVRCALHADLAASSEQDEKSKARWLRQKEALVLFAAKSGASAEQLESWISEFTDEIIRAKGAEHTALVRQSSNTCQAFLSEHGDHIIEVNSRSASGDGG